MESTASNPQNKPKICCKAESRPKNQNQEASAPPDVRGGNGNFQVKTEEKTVDSLTQTKTQSSTVIPSTLTTLAPASATASSTSRTLLVQAAKASSITSTAIQDTTLTAGTSEHKIKYSRDGELKSSDEKSLKNVHKTTTHISPTTHLQKSLQKTTPAAEGTKTLFSQIPRTTSSPKLRPSPTTTLTVKRDESHFREFQRDKDADENRDRKEEEEEEATNTTASQVKKTAGKTDGNALAQERECEREKRTDGKEAQEALEKRSGHKEIDQEKKTEEKIEKERTGQDQNCEAREKEKEVGEMKLNQIKSFKDAATMTEENSDPVQTHDAALQTDLLYKVAEIQADVEVSNKSTSMSPNMTCPSWSLMDPMADISNHEKGSGKSSMSIQNGLVQDVSVGSGLAPITFASEGSMVKSLSPAHQQSSISTKPTRQHVCEIQIELCSQSTLSDSLALPEEEESRPSSTRSGPEREPKELNRNGDHDVTSPLPEVAWDEQGMTWEVYGAAVDMESLGFAIQNHLQHKINEHEQRIGHLRKSISLSEHSNSDGKRGGKNKKKRNVFRSLFQTSTCCLKTKSEA